MPWTNYHSHTLYCDGSDHPELYIQSAIEKGLPAYGYSSHAPVSFETDWCVADSIFVQYLSDIANIKEKYNDKIQTYLGLEIDFIPGIAGRRKHILANCELDYFIGSIHFVDSFYNGEHWNIDTSKELFDKGLKEIFKNNFRKAAQRFYELTWQMLEVDKPDIIGHIDKIKMFNKGSTYFSENEKWYKDLIELTIEKIIKYGTIVEINTRGYYRYGQKELYPGDWIIDRLIQKNVPIMLNSDSHAPKEIVSGFDYAANELKKYGLKELWLLLDNKWQSKKFDEKGIII